MENFKLAAKNQQDPLKPQAQPKDPW